MDTLNWIYKKVFNLFYGFNTTGTIEKDDVTCSVDGVDVECLSFDLIDRGFYFNVEEDWYERTWTVATKNGAETSKEVYQKKRDLDGNVHWKTMMFGDGCNLFYEQTIGKKDE